ncbi:hypothetical protein QE152_g10570 [Popillia japonica]|uniref:Endonuclease/exonuclease/phosphatase domain-containing protein n=1 Tax=Popillia japonica TaxID=7064 RepID=A0AAW1LQV6_POPJA
MDNKLEKIMEMITEMMKDTKEIKNEQRELEKIMEMITEMMKDTKEIKNEQREYREEFNIIKDQINNYKQVIGKLKTENEELKREMKKMQESIVKIEKKEIQNNIIINGIAVERENPNQLKEKIETKLEAYLGIKSKIKEVTKISRTLCKVELENYRVYGPDEDEKAENKEEFWDDLTLAVEESKGDIYLLGDFNARVGKKDVLNQDVTGKYGEDAIFVGRL